MLHASGSPIQDLCLRMEWLFLSSSAEDKEGSKSTCNVNHISKSNSASYEHNSQYKVVMMQTIESGLCFFPPTDVTYTSGWILGILSSAYAKLYKPLHFLWASWHTSIEKNAAPPAKGRLSGAVILIISMHDLWHSTQCGKWMSCAPPPRKGTKARLDGL